MWRAQKTQELTLAKNLESGEALANTLMRQEHHATMGRSGDNISVTGRILRGVFDYGKNLTSATVRRSKRCSKPRSNPLQTVHVTDEGAFFGPHESSQRRGGVE